MTDINPTSMTLSQAVIQNDYDADEVVIGGGPIGLFYAIQNKILTGKKIVVIEKYHDYRRSDIRLKIDPSSFNGIPNDEKLKKIIFNWRGKLIPIKEMEETFEKRAHELGIKIIKGYEADPKTLPQLFPKAKVFVGADGARSRVRKEIFGDLFRFNTIQQYMVQVQYIVNAPKMEENQSSLKNKIRSIRDLSTTYSMQKFAQHLILQKTRPQEDGSSIVTLQIFTDKETFDQMSGASFKNPYYFEKDLNRIPNKLREILMKWWGAREELYNEVISVDSSKNKFTAIALGSYAAQEVVKTDESGRVWVLVGDAAEAFPFFRAINNGLLMATKLSQDVAKAFKAQDKGERDPFSSNLKSYSRYAIWRAYVERIRAFCKNVFLGMSKLWIKVSHFIPWPTIKFRAAQRDRCYARGMSIWSRLRLQRDIDNKNYYNILHSIE